MMLYELLYRDYLDRKQFLPAAHAGGMVFRLTDLYAQRAGTPEARQLAKIKSTLAADEKELRKKLDAAKDADDKKQVEFLIKEKYAFAADDALEIAEANKKDDVGLDAAALAVELLGKYKITGPSRTKAAARYAIRCRRSGSDTTATVSRSP